MIAPPDQLVERASRRSGGLADFGPSGWEEGLDRLVSSVAEAIGDDVEAVAGIEEIVVGRLEARLAIEDWYGRHGEEAAEPVAGPLVIVGLPRTGTTALHYLLSMDQRFRYLRSWEARNPTPPPEAATEQADPRRKARRSVDDVRHIAAVDGPAEDGPIHALDFRNGELVLPARGYTAWWRGADHASAFAYHERVLRLLHSSRPPHLWLLKFPAYIFQLPSLVARYPDARFVMTHRDPVEALPSTCSTIADSRLERLPHLPPDPNALGREILDHFAEGMRRAMSDRVLIGDDRFLDVGQREIAADPLDVAERVYEFSGLALEDGPRGAMAEWAAENRRGSRGEHVYDAGQFGVTETGIRRSFADYIDRFGGLWS